MDDGPGGRMYEAFGAYVRSQRELAQLSLRQAAELARISNPYLSQIEHGMALPSVRVIGALADALKVSTDTLLLRAAGVPTGRSAGTEDAIRQDPRLDDAQKHALLAVLTSFVAASPSPPATADRPDGDAPPAASRAPQRRKAPKAQAPRREVNNHA